MPGALARRLIGWAGALAAALGLAASGCQTAQAPEAAGGRPNIVLMVVEDLSPRIGAFGDRLASTPNLDRLAQQGVRYTNVFAAAGVCAPSRAALITGMHQNAIGAGHMRTSSFVWEAGSARRGYEAVPPPEVKAFPELMRRAGYYAVNNAKTDYQFGNPFTVWDESGPQASWKNRAEDQPFFAMYSQQATHESALFLLDQIVNAGGEASRANTEQASAARGRLGKRTRPEDVVVPPYYPATPTVRADIARQYDNVQVMDAWVGERLAELEQAGLAKNTVVIWTTDHGDGLPRAKRSLYDTGLHAPMIIRFPDGRGAGTVDEQLVSFVDLAPTLLALADAARPDYLRGRDFLRGGRRGQDHVFAARDRFDEAYLDRSRAVRSKSFKYIRNYLADAPFYGDVAYRDNIPMMREMRRLQAEGKLSPLQASYFATPRPAEELYDLAADPDEVNNLAGDPRHAQTKAGLKAALERWQAEVPDWASEPERQMVERMWPGGVQPQTAAPVFRFHREGTGRQVAELTSATAGASIGYRMKGEPRWRLYAGSFEAPDGARFEAKAVRYGYKESPVAEGSSSAGSGR